MKKELLHGLTDEQFEKARECGSIEELLSLANEEGFELTSEQLASINGGCGKEAPKFICPSCGSSSRIDYRLDIFANKSRGCYKCTCLDCGTYFEVDY